MRSRWIVMQGFRAVTAMVMTVLLAGATVWAQEPCPGAVRFDVDGPNTDIDPGWTGMAHDNHYVGLTITMGIGGCAGSMQPSCGTCSLTGPIANGGGATFNNRRCSDKSWLTCTVDADCIGQGAAGPCNVFFGPPLPYAAGGVGVCVVNEITAAGSGNIGVESGDVLMNLPYRASIYNAALGVSQPCPQCVAGTCNSGARNGMSCTTNGTSPLFGNVSFDCPPLAGALIGTLIPTGLTLGTSPQSKTLSAASPNCRAPGFTALKCFCDVCNSGTTPIPCTSNADCPDPPGPIGPICGGKKCHGGTNAGAACTTNTECPGTGTACTQDGTATAPNQCDDAVCSPNPLDTDSPDEGECSAGPYAQHCAIETFRECLNNADCPASGDTCSTISARQCFNDNGLTGGSITAGGVADPPNGNVAAPTLGSVFCIPTSSNPSVNIVGGFPGPGRVTLPSLLTLADEIADGTVGSGGTVTTDTEADGATPSDPLETTVTSPNAGEIILEEQAATGTPPGGYVFLGKQVNITAPAASAASPLLLVFRIDASRIPAGENENTIVVFKNSTPLPNCTGPGATPDPCVGTRALLGDGDVELTIRTSTASLWNFGAPVPLCPPTPDNTCRIPQVPQKASVLMKTNPNPTKHLEVWKWIKGDATTFGDFGDPTTSTTYALCVYDASGLLAEANVSPGGTCDGKPCWSAKIGKSYKYKAKTPNAAGITLVQLKAGDFAKASVQVKGKGANLSLPTLPLSMSPLTVQLRQDSSAVCWSAQYSFPPATKNDASEFKDKAD